MKNTNIKNITNLNNNIQFNLTDLSKNNITFLSDTINNNKKLFKIGYYHYFKIPGLEMRSLRDFLSQLQTIWIKSFRLIILSNIDIVVRKINLSLI